MSYSTLSLKTAFTGIQPFGRLHLGNYFGAIKWMIEQQDKPDMRRFFCLVDLHSFTSSERRTIADDTLKAASTLLACGLDPRKTILFRQSDVLEHANLMWLLMSSVSVSQLQRMIQWKVRRPLNLKTKTLGKIIVAGNERGATIISSIAGGRHITL